MLPVQGEPAAIAAPAAPLEGMVPNEDARVPSLDETLEPTPDGAVRLAQAEPPRFTPEMVARMASHNDVSRPFLDINDAP